MLKTDYSIDGEDYYLPHYTNVNGTIYFYGGTFSNFVGEPLILRHPHTGEFAEYQTVEHWFQACKSKTHEGHELVRLEPDTWAAKGYGQGVPMRDDWDTKLKFGAMATGLRAKFSRDTRWGDELIATGNLVIAEDSPTDFVWGIRDEEGGFTGRNLLGLALMLVRDELLGVTWYKRYDKILQLATTDVDRDLIVYDKFGGEPN